MKLKTIASFWLWRSLRCALLLAAVALLAGPSARAQGVKIKLATLAPDGSAWHLILKDMGEQWKQLSGSRVTMVIYPGGVAGDEPDMVRKMRIGQIHAAAVTGTGLSEIDPGVQALQIPMLYQTDDEFDYMAKDLKPLVNPELVVIAEAKGTPVGFGLSLPDLNVVLKGNKKGRLIPGLIRLLLFKKRIDGVRIIILGVVPEYLNTGIGGVLFYETGLRCVAQGYPHGEASWILEDNVRMNRGAELLQGEKTKTYRLYQIPLSS